eukprot:8202164-Alexandrium_andersonii.AAC.1
MVLQGKCYYFRVLVFGAASAPAVWGRFAAWLGRPTAALVDPSTLRLAIYVGDALYVAGGSLRARAKEGSVALPRRRARPS